MADIVAMEFIPLKLFMKFITLQSLAAFMQKKTAHF